MLNSINSSSTLRTLPPPLPHYIAILFILIATLLIVFVIFMCIPLPTAFQTPRKPASTISNDENSARRNRVSKSQPGSRSASPSSRLSYYSNIPSSESRNRALRSRKLSTTSREQSPTRTPAYERRLSSSSSASRNHRNYMMNSDLDLSNKKILHHNDEQIFENALLVHTSSARKKYYDDHSDESETSR